jgi:hypothetical protein
MRLLTEVPDSFAAAELVGRLQQASCFAIFVERCDDPAVGRMTTCAQVYVSDDTDMQEAAEVLQQFLEDGYVSRGAQCDGCGYDLRGHTGEGKCPECGRRFQLRAAGAAVSSAAADSESSTCPSCGEDVPPNFQCCWNCGEAMA